MSIETSRLRIYHFLLQLPNRWEVARQAGLGGERTIAYIIRRHGHGQTRILEKIEAIIPEPLITALPPANWAGAIVERAWLLAGKPAWSTDEWDSIREAIEEIAEPRPDAPAGT